MLTSVDAVWPAADVAVTVADSPCAAELFMAYSFPSEILTVSPASAVDAARVFPEPPDTVNTEVEPSVPARRFREESPVIVRVSSTSTVTSTALVWP